MYKKEITAWCMDHDQVVKTHFEGWIVAKSTILIEHVWYDRLDSDAKIITGKCRKPVCNFYHCLLRRDSLAHVQLMIEGSGWLQCMNVKCLERNEVQFGLEITLQLLVRRLKRAEKNTREIVSILINP